MDRATARGRKSCTPGANGARQPGGDDDRTKRTGRVTGVTVRTYLPGLRRRDGCHKEDDGVTNTEVRALRDEVRTHGLRGYPVAKMDGDTCQRFVTGQIDAAAALWETADRHAANGHLRECVERWFQAQGTAPVTKPAAAPAPAANAEGRNWETLIRVAGALGVDLAGRFAACVDEVAQLRSALEAARQAAPAPAPCTDTDGWGVDPAYVPIETARTAARLIGEGRPVYLVGPAGSGKSMALRWACSQLRRRMLFCSMHGHVMADSLEGYSWLAVEDGATVQRWCEGIVQRALQDGAILVVDEFDRAPAAVQHMLNDVLQSGSLTLREGPRAGERIDAAPGFLVVATGNTTDGSTGQFSSTAIDKSTLSRFRVLFVDFDTDTEVRILEGLGLNGTSKALVDAVGQVRQACRAGDLPTMIGTRHLIHLAQDIQAGYAPADAWAWNVAMHQGGPDDPAYDMARAIGAAIDGPAH